MTTSHTTIKFFLLLVLHATVTTDLRASYVTPQMGGGQVGMAAAPMRHIDIWLDGTQVTLHVDESVDTPMLRPLAATDQFDPAAAWSVLDGTSYNFQYGWMASGVISIPPSAAIWMEQLDASPGLEVYQRPPASPAYAPVFGTDGSSTRWQWSGSMTHNAYAVASPTLDHYEATYNVYVGDVTTGEPLDGYSPMEVTLDFTAEVFGPGDFNHDGRVDLSDYQMWKADFGKATGSFADGNGDGTVNAADYTIWRNHLGAGSSNFASAVNQVPEPATWVATAISAAAGVLLLRRTRHRAVRRS